MPERSRRSAAYGGVPVGRAERCSSAPDTRKYILLRYFSRCSNAPLSNSEPSIGRAVPDERGGAAEPRAQHLIKLPRKWPPAARGPSHILLLHSRAFCRRGTAHAPPFPSEIVPRLHRSRSCISPSPLESHARRHSYPTGRASRARSVSSRTRPSRRGAPPPPHCTPLAAHAPRLLSHSDLAARPRLGEGRGADGTCGPWPFATAIDCRVRGEAAPGRTQRGAPPCRHAVI